MTPCAFFPFPTVYKSEKHKLIVVQQRAPIQKVGRKLILTLHISCFCLFVCFIYNVTSCKGSLIHCHFEFWIHVYLKAHLILFKKVQPLTCTCIFEFFGHLIGHSHECLGYETNICLSSSSLLIYLNMNWNMCIYQQATYC